MASTLLVDCDRCKARILEGRTLARITTGALRQRLSNVDLCISCASAFEAWLSNGNGQAPVDPIEQRAAKHPASQGAVEPATRPRRTRKPK